MVEAIPFYALHKSKVLIILCKADGFCLFIGLPDEIYKCRLVSLERLLMVLAYRSANAK